MELYFCVEFTDIFGKKNKNDSNLKSSGAEYFFQLKNMNKMFPLVIHGLCNIWMFPVGKDDGLFC